MAWLRWNDDFINIEKIASIEIKETDAGKWAIFYNDANYEVWEIKVADEIYEEFIAAIQAATNAVKLPVKRGEKDA
jgi:hypothetical protein